MATAMGPAVYRCHPRRHRRGRIEGSTIWADRRIRRSVTHGVTAVAELKVRTTWGAI